MEVAGLVKLYATFLVLALVHELSHAAAAARRGIGVQRVVLGVGPTVARFRIGPFPVELKPIPLVCFVKLEGGTWDTIDPHTQARIALSGPAANLALGILCLVPYPTAVAAGVLSLILAAMNLVPLPPLDGGMAVHAVLRARYGSAAAEAYRRAGLLALTGITAFLAADLLVKGFGIWAALCAVAGGAIAYAYLRLRGLSR